MIIEVSCQDTRSNEVFNVTSNKCIIGRSQNSDVAIKRDELSRNHLQVDYENGELYVTDLHSTNGVKVNGERLVAGIKTPYKTIFPLEIAELITITVTTDEEKDEITQSRLRSSSSPRFQSQGPGHERNTTLTKTKFLSSSGSVTKEKTVKKAEPPKKKLLQFSGAGIVLLLSILGYIQMYNEADTTVETKAASQPSALDKFKKDPARIPQLDMKEMDFKSILKKNQCDTFGDLCRSIGLTGLSEGLVLLDNKMIVFVNLETFSPEGTHPTFNALNDKDKSEIIMAKMGTHPGLQQIIKVKEPTHLLVVGFTLLDDIIRTKYLLNMSYKQLPLLEEDLHQYLFSEIFYGGLITPYKKYVGYYANMSEI